MPGNAAELCYVRKSPKFGIGPGLSEVIEFALTFGSGAISSLIANWLYEKLKNNDIKVIRFERKEIELSKDGIQKAIEESYTIEK